MTPAHSDALVFFGATGDLAYKKILPALHEMARRGALDMPVIGVARSGWTMEQLRERARDSIAHHGAVDEAAFGRLVQRLRYIDADYREAGTFRAIREALGSAAHPLHYLAIPPGAFPVVVEGLGRSGCAQDGRVVLEKPFGRDLASAQALNATLRAEFDEASVFRIDHYLGKEPVQNLALFRFANTFVEPIWNRNYVDSVQVTMAEDIGVEGRGAFYDEVGALRDVVQNHMLQVVSLLAMEAPVRSYPESFRDEQVKVFRTMRPLSPDDCVRGQFRGYRDEKGVAKGSTTETFAAVRLHLDSWRWEGVPFFIRAGKHLPTAMTEVLVKLKRPPLSRMAPGESNYYRFRLGPDVVIAVGARVKRPGPTLVGEPTELKIVHHPGGDERDAYDRLLGDAMAGDPTLFAREDGVEAAWAVVQPVLGDATPVHPYEPGTWGPKEAERLTASAGGWYAPSIDEER